MSLEHSPSRDGRKTMSVPEAGKLYFEMGRAAAYEAAARGDIPTIRVGKLLRVPIAAMERMLEQAGQPKSDKAA
jgi:hypothetical protein